MLPHSSGHLLPLAKVKVDGALAVKLEVVDLLPVAGQGEGVRDAVRGRPGREEQLIQLNRG